MRPDDLTLSLFVYGTFQPGELAWLRLRDSVESAQLGWFVDGELRERDGLAILDLDARAEVPGWLLQFHSGAVDAAYRSIADLEPQRQYRWAQVTAVRDGVEQRVNVLAGKRPHKGATPLEGPWAGRTDPLLTVGVDVVAEMAANVGDPSPADVAPLLRLQAAYMLLFTAVERYASLRYGLRGDDIMAKLHKVAAEPAFATALAAQVTDDDEVYRADDPGRRERLDPADPRGSMDYYYQLRSNITHRGKAAVVDFDRLAAATESMRAIFQDVVTAAFADAAVTPPGPP